MANTKTNIFGGENKGEYEYKYIWIDKKGQIQIRLRLFGLVFANANIIVNICHKLHIEERAYIRIYLENVKKKNNLSLKCYHILLKGSPHER